VSQGGQFHLLKTDKSVVPALFYSTWPEKKRLNLSKPKKTTSRSRQAPSAVASRKKMDYLIRFSQSHETFRLPEIQALAVIEGIDLKVVSYSLEVSFEPILGSLSLPFLNSHPTKLPRPLTKINNNPLLTY
jgi:hypothetical protein